MKIISGYGSWLSNNIDIILQLVLADVLQLIVIMNLGWIVFIFTLIFILAM